MLEELPITRTVLDHPVRRFNIGSGEDATTNTLQLMSDIIKESSKNSYVRRWAEFITSNVGSNQLIEKVDAIYKFILGNTEYVHDPLHFEFIKTPLVSLQQLETKTIPHLDCDDLTVLSLSLLSSLGYRVALRAASYTSDHILSHVYGFTEVFGKWYALDCTQHEEIGWEAPGVTYYIDLEVK